MAVQNTKTATDTRFNDNKTKNRVAGPITFGISANGPTSYAGTTGTVGAQPTGVTPNSQGPFPGLEQDQFI